MADFPALPSVATRDHHEEGLDGVDALCAGKVEHSVNLCIIKYNPTIKAIS